MSERTEPPPAQRRTAAQVLPGDAVVVHRKPLTVIVAVDGDQTAVALVATAMVDELIDSADLSFGPVAEALQSFVVAHQPVGVAAVLDVGPDPIAFLFDRATVLEPSETHHGSGRSGWNTVFVGGPEVVVAAGDDDLAGGTATDWSRLLAGTVAGGGVRMWLSAEAAPAPAEVAAVGGAAVGAMAATQTLIDQSTDPTETEHATAEDGHGASAEGHDTVGADQDPAVAGQETLGDGGPAAKRTASTEYPEPGENAPTADVGAGSGHPRSAEAVASHGTLDNRLDPEPNAATTQQRPDKEEAGAAEPDVAATGVPAAGGLRFDPFSPDESFFRSAPAARAAGEDTGTGDGEPFDRSPIGDERSAEDAGPISDRPNLAQPAAFESSPTVEPEPTFDSRSSADQETVTETWIPGDQPTGGGSPDTSGPPADDGWSTPAGEPGRGDPVGIDGQGPELERTVSALAEPFPSADAAVAPGDGGPGQGLPGDAVPPAQEVDQTGGPVEEIPAIPPSGTLLEPTSALPPPTESPLTGHPPMPNDGQPPTPDAAPLTGQPPTPDAAPLTGQPPLPGAPLTGQPPLPDQPITGQPPTPDGPPLTGQPPMPDAAPRGDAPPMPPPDALQSPAADQAPSPPDAEDRVLPAMPDQFAEPAPEPEGDRPTDDRR